MLDKITEALEDNLSTAVLLIDLSKAFDSLDHSILLAKLEHYGIRGTPQTLFKNYLKNRSQYVSYNNTSSHYSIIKTGVPQGSILGPLLFLLYINDIHHPSSLCSFFLFADDTTVLGSDKNPETLSLNMNNEITHLDKWFKANKLSLNREKTKYIVFTGNGKKETGKNLINLINEKKISLMELL